MSERPSLRCAWCDEPLVPAALRGIVGEEEWVEQHDDTCDCGCDWIWWEDGTSYPCKECGAVCVVQSDGENAHMHMISEEPKEGRNDSEENP